jgi:multiple sugar transport system substrate-binding protein
LSGALRIVGWDHPRCRGPLKAAAASWTELTGEGVELRFRTLEQFGDQPLEEIDEPGDLVVYDHPHVPHAAETNALIPFDELLPAERVASLAADAVGPSHGAYTWSGRQYGLACDAACQVMAYRPDRLESPPGNWQELAELAEQVPGSVALPGHPTHLLCAYLTLCANLGGDWLDTDCGEQAVEILRRLWSPVRQCGEPPALLTQLTRSDGRLAVIPIVFGYVSYTMPGSAVDVPCAFRDLPSAGYGPVGGLLGGAGLGVPSNARDPHAAAEFAAWYCSPDVQVGLVAGSGGQPASRTAWSNASVNERVHGFYAGTLATMEQASMRPRHAAWPRIQVTCGRTLADGLAAGRRPEQIVRSIAEGAAAVGADVRSLKENGTP